MNHIALRSNTHGFADERELRAEVDRLWRVVAEFSRAMSRGGIKFGSEKDMGIDIVTVREQNKQNKENEDE